MAATTIRPFPRTSYQRIAAGDLLDLFGFLKTLPAIEGRAPEHALPFPYSVRRAVGLWKLAFLDGRLFSPDPAAPPPATEAPIWSRAPGTAPSATASGTAPAPSSRPPLRRRAGLEGRGAVPNITSDPSGIGGWTVEDLATMLKTGETPNFVNVGGLMGLVVKNTAQLPEADRRAIAEFLLSLPPKAGYKAPAPAQPATPAASPSQPP